MFLDDVPVNYWGVLVAAILLYVLGALWYSPLLFGDCCIKNDEPLQPGDKEKSCCYGKIGAYIGEFICSLVIAFVLALFIAVSDAEKIVEGIAVAIWAWLGFIATTHLSNVFWRQRTFKHYLVHVSFLLIGFIAMGAAIMWMGIP